MTTFSVIAILTTSGAAAPSSAGTFQARESAASPHVAPVHCSARKAVRYYAGRIAYWRSKMGTGFGEMRAARNHAAGRCPKYLARVLQRKAYAAHKAFIRWHRHEYEWRSWLPRLWFAIGMCETGLNWQHNSGTYQGAFGFWYGTWDAYKPSGAPSEAYLATPRQQYEAALNVAARVGLGAWGCYSHGGYRYHL